MTKKEALAVVPEIYEHFSSAKKRKSNAMVVQVEQQPMLLAEDQSWIPNRSPMNKGETIQLRRRVNTIKYAL